MINGFIGFFVGLLFTLFFVVPVFLRDFIKDNCNKTFTEKVDDVVYYVTITDVMPPSKER